ncbi:hypothetical protein ACFLY1_00040 [Patescibacteria group bacterium]
MAENEKKKSTKGGGASTAVFQAVIFSLILFIAAITVLTSVGWLPDKISFDIQFPKITRIAN